MVVINGLGGVAAYRAAGRRAGPSGFRLAEGGVPETEGPAAAAPVSMPSLLGLQEAQGDAVRDRDARRHAGETLDTLRDLQLALLGGGRPDAAAGLDRLAERMPEAATPELRGVQRALLLRVAVERARHKAAASL